ncbi:MAG: type II CAAX endopeptidase family protein [Patescibacteria group bacterium]|nr:type II CAAX endopeptidase family protein [Patescibacteria group bacterium]
MNECTTRRESTMKSPGPRWKPQAILLASTVLMVTWWHFGSPQFYREHLAASISESSAAPALYYFMSCFLLLGVVPAIIVKLVFREPLSRYGVQLGDRVRTPRSLLVLAPLFVLGGYISSHNSAIAAYYPINPLACDSLQTFGCHAIFYLLYYVGWEFHFRGFLQFGLRDAFGPASALLVQVMASSLLHFGKPGIETYAAILGGILWGYIAYRTRSLLSGLGQHYLLGLSVDVFLCRR